MFLNGKSLEQCAEELADSICQSFKHLSKPNQALLRKAIIAAYCSGSNDQILSYSERLRRGVSNIDPEAVLRKIEKRSNES